MELKPITRIEKLHESPIMDRDGTIYGTSLPTDSQMYRKINELVDEVNKLKEKLSEYEYLEYMKDYPND